MSLTITKQRNLNWLLTILLLPLVLSFALPLFFYQVPIKLNRWDKVVELTGADIVNATLVWMAWIGIAAITPLLLAQVKPSIGIEKFWKPTTLWRGYIVLSIIGCLVSPMQYFFSFHSGIEQLLNQLLFAPVVAVVVGIRAMQEIDIFEKRWRSLILSGGVLLLGLNIFSSLVLPVVLGRAAPAIYAGLAILYGVHCLKIDKKKLIIIWLVFIALTGLAMTYRSNFRSSWFGSTFWHHGQYIRIPIADVLSGRLQEAYRARTAGRSFDLRSSLDLGEDRSFSEYDINYYNIRFFSRDKISEKPRYLLSKTLSRINHLGELAYVVRVTPDEIPYLQESTYYPLLFKPIPRLLWRDKPEDNSGQIYGHRYGMLHPTDSITSTNMGMVIEAWVNGGWTLVVLTGFAFGMLIYLVWRYILGESGEIGNFVLGTVFVASGVRTESSANLVVGGMLYAMIVWYIVEFLIRKKL